MTNEIERLQAELEDERMRHAACGVVANANTEQSAKQQRQMDPKYWSGSVQAVADAVDREMHLRAERDALKQTLHDELDGNLRLRELGGALPSEPMTVFLERVIAERDALKAKIGNFEDDANRWRWLADTTLWTCELNQYSGPSAREYLWSTRFSAPYHEGNGGLIGAIDAARKE